jgi:hypothetical protein
MGSYCCGAGDLKPASAVEQRLPAANIEPNINSANKMAYVKS